MREIIIVIDIIAAIGVIGLVLLQQGKGADMGAAFGSGASTTLFGSRGAANFLTRMTAILATIFFIANLALAWMATRDFAPKGGVTQTLTEPARQEPAVPAPEKPAEGRPGLPPEVPK